ncbi:hypothetical protein N7456_002319 [Penicillium angulare]|uniref:Cutinase n=1 Tax=Penicillium angulare TaxID=116970 RepID=A0A9W9G7V7_9EURO|nr:hypothetical protein N7456_002319 [Penicillium angulare]
MHLVTTIASLLLGGHLATATPVQDATTQLVNSTACSNVHIMIARGTTESYPGSLETLAELISANNEQTTYENIIYPATDETSTNSYHVGKKAFDKQLTQFVELCGNTKSKLVVLAYSQGVMVVADTLAGGGGDAILGNLTAPIDVDIGKHIDALVLYGDPRHAPYQPYDEGFNTSSVTGKYPRPKFQVEHLTKYYGHIIQDYCNVGDPVCASGDNITAHLVYPDIWDTTAASWVQEALDRA